MVNLDYDTFGITRKVSPEEAKMPAKWLSFINSDSNLNQIEKFGVVAIIKALQDFGGPTKSSLVKEKASEYPFFTDSDRERKSTNGNNQLDFRLQWAMSNLKKAGLLHSPKRGIWDLTPLGKEVNLNEFDVWDDVYAISTPLWEEARSKKSAQKKQNQTSLTTQSVDEDTITDSDDAELWREQLLTKLQEMNPYKFEELIVNLMRKIGIRMETTSKSNDSGIDGIGYLRTPELMTYL